MQQVAPDCAITICGETSRFRLWLHWRLIALAKVATWFSPALGTEIVYAAFVVLGVQYRILNGVPRKLSPDVIKPALSQGGVYTELELR